MYVIAKRTEAPAVIQSGLDIDVVSLPVWQYFANRVKWTDRVVLAGIFLDQANAFANIDLLPNGDEEGCVVLPLTFIVNHENPAIDDGRRR